MTDTTIKTIVDAVAGIIIAVVPALVSMWTRRDIKRHVTQENATTRAAMGLFDDVPVTDPFRTAQKQRTGKPE